MKVLKFGGTSMANANSIAQVASIVSGDPKNGYVIVSAPGRREKTDTKVTDMLYSAFDEFVFKKKLDLSAIKTRFDDIISGLKIELDLSAEFAEIEKNLKAGKGKDYIASRGEFLSAIVLAKFLGWQFIDATQLICFSSDGEFLAEETNDKAKEVLKKYKHAVIPGFYGIDSQGEIRTFSRGGSDVSGAIIARAACAEVYENWTDVDGFMTCDPRIVDKPALMDMLTYKELRELSYMGANVLHPDSVFPIRKNDIPINIRNTFNPSHKGTMIVPTQKYLNGEFARGERRITGIAGKKDFLAIFVEKSMMNNELGFARRILSILEDNEISIEHMPSGIDTMTVVVDATGLSDKTVDAVVSRINVECTPDKVEVLKGLALIAIVGHGMSQRTGTAAKVCTALANDGINIRMIDQGSSELNIIVGVESGDYDKSIRALYNEFTANK